MARRVWLAGAATVVLAGLAVLTMTRGSDPRILWWQGRAVSWSGRDQGAVWTPDGELLRFRPGPDVARLTVRLAGRVVIEAVVDGRGGVLLVDGSGTVVRRRDAGDVEEVEEVEEVGRTPVRGGAGREVCCSGGDRARSGRRGETPLTHLPKRGSSSTPRPSAILLTNA